MNTYPLALFIILLTAYGCNTNSEKELAESPDPLTEDMDTTVKPGDNFFLYANGGWLKKSKIPDEEAVWGIGNLVDEELYLRKRAINEKAVKDNAPPGTISRKIADFYTTAMDSVSIDKAGLAPLQPWLDSISKAGSVPDLLRLNARLRQIGASPMFNASIIQDQMNSEKMVVDLSQGGLGLPDRDYYFDTDQKTVAVRQAYKREMQQVFQSLGMDSNTASASMNKVFAMETRLAKASRKLADLRDPYKNYHKMTVQKFAAFTPNINWQQYFSFLGIKNLDTVIVDQPEFYLALNKELTSTPPEVWKNYLQFNLVSDIAPYLDNNTYMIVFEYRKALYGIKSPRPRWKRVLDMEERSMGEALGQLFVQEYFNDTARQRYNDLVESIRTVYKEHIEHLTWMSDSTKEKALAKLAHIKKKVGYPDKWKDFRAMQIGSSSYAQNVMNANKWWFNYQLSKLGKPVDRDEWIMSPQTYNAYYRSGNNEIVLPAGIFTVPGRRDADLDDAFVYGYAGASTIGHEITHGFDDQGRQYDALGNLKSWWTQKIPHSLHGARP